MSPRNFHCLQVIYFYVFGNSNTKVAKAGCHSMPWEVVPWLRNTGDEPELSTLHEAANRKSRDE